MYHYAMFCNGSFTKFELNCEFWQTHPPPLSTCDTQPCVMSCKHVRNGVTVHGLAGANMANSLNVLDKFTVCKAANLISMAGNFKGITWCNCQTSESINHCSVRSSCNFFSNAGIYFPRLPSFHWFHLTRSFERLIAAIFKNNKLVSLMYQRPKKKKRGLPNISTATQTKTSWGIYTFIHENYKI